MNIPLIVIYKNLHYLVEEVKEIEFYFDFKKSQVNVLKPECLIKKGNSWYSKDWRRHCNRPTRKSFLVLYNRFDRLVYLRQVNWKAIKANPYKNRIEFRITKENSKLRTLNDITGTYLEVIKRYTSYLAVIYSREFYGIVDVEDFSEHPCFYLICEKAAEGRKRYTGKELEKREICKDTIGESNFYHHLLYLDWFSNAKNYIGTNKMADLALSTLCDSHC
jgi:hypothetical protein